MFEKVCDDCGCVFYAKSKRTHICPTCKRKRLSQQAKRRNLNKIGNDAYSAQRECAKKAMEISGMPCENCALVEDNKVCDNKNCVIWQAWFLDKWQEVCERLKDGDGNG